MTAANTDLPGHRPQGRSCHDESAVETAPAGAPVIALVGAPNAGKSTLFNSLTGARRSVGNWPGTTVEVGSGIWPARLGLRRDATVLDLPGAYSLDPVSPDEALTRELIWEVPAERMPDAVVVTVDAAHLARSLYLVAQLRERPMRLLVAVTMADVALRRGVRIRAPQLAASVGVPVVVLDPRKRQGHEDLGRALQAVLDEPPPAPRDQLPAATPGDEPSPGPVTEAPAGPTTVTELPAGPTTVTELPAGPIQGDDLELALADDRFAWIDTAVAAGLRHTGINRVTWSDRIDRWATAPITGPLIFLVMMWLVFQVTTTVAAPLQNGLDGLFAGPVTEATQAGLDRIGLGDTPVAGFLTDGIIAGVGMLLTFIPLMALMFVLLAILEDSGYMARAAVVTDRLMRRLGLPGRAFLPLVVGFGCNVPAISATRILGQARQRVLIALLVPFTSCTARLTVYVMLATIFFPHAAGTVVFILYVVSILLVMAVGMGLRATLWRTMGSESLVLDLPPYQRPVPRLVFSVMWLRLRGFLRTAGGIIVAAVAVVWLLQATPASTRPGESFGQAFGHVQVQDSAYAAVAQTISPVFAPAGFDRWETSSALVVGFVAKEAVVSSWAQTYAVAAPEDTDGRSAGDLHRHVRAAFEDSSDGHPLAAVAAFLVFLLAYTPCVATFSAQRREIGLRWATFGMGMQLVTAWVLAVLIFQIGRLIA